MSKKFSKNVIGLFLPALIILMISGSPHVLTAASNDKDVLFTFQPKYSDTNPPLLKGLGIVQAKIYIYETGNAHGKSKGNINYVSETNVYKGSWKYIFEGSYDSSSKRLTGDVRLSMNETQFYKGTAASRIKRDLKGKLEAKVNNSILEGKVTSVFNILQTPLNLEKYPEHRGLSDKETINLSWSFTADAGDTDETVSSDEESKKDSGVRFSGLNGQIEVYLPGSKTWTLAKWDQEIPVGTRIKVGNEDGDDESSAVLSFADMSTFVLRSGSEIVITGPPNKKDRASLVRGSIWANVKKMIKDGSMDIKMNQAVASIKGTTFVLEETGSSSTLKVIEGIVDFKSKKDGKIIKVNAREKIVATKDGFEDKTNFDADKENADWKALRSQIENNNSSIWILALSAIGALVVILSILKIISSRKKQ